MSAPADKVNSSVPAAGGLEPSWQEAHARLEAMLNALPDLLFVLDRDGRIYDYHAPRLDRLYVPPEKFLGHTMAEVLPEPAARIVNRAIQDAVAHGYHSGSIYPLTTPAGPRWFEITIAAQGDLQAPAGRLVAIVRDITARKQAESALRESEERFAQNAQQTRTFVWELDDQGLYTFVSPVVEEVLGYRPEEIIGKLHFYDLYPADGREAYQQAVFAAAREGGPFRNFENPMVAKDGRIVWVSTNAFPLRGADGALRGFRGSDMDINARKLTELALQASEARFAASTRASRSYVWEVDRAGLFTFVHPMVAEVLGYQPEEIAGRLHFYDLVPEEDRAQVKRFGLEVMARREAITGFENRSRTRDGRWIWLRSSASPAYDAAGAYRGYLGIDTDITERKQAETALRESEVRFRELFERMRDGLVMVDMTGHLVGCNPAFAALLGYREEELRGKHFREITPPGWEAVDAEGLRQVLQQGFDVAREKAYVRKNGSIVPVEVVGSLMRDAQSCPTGILVVVRDITERKIAEEALLQAHDELERRVRERTAELEGSRAALAQSEEQFRQMAENVREAFWLIDAKTGKVMYTSPALDRIWHRPGRELREDISGWFATIHPEDRARVLQAFARGMKTGEPGQITYRLLWPDGSVRWIETSGSMIYDRQGNPLRAVGVIRDITEPRRLEAEILRAAEAERQRIGRDLHDSLGQSLTAIGYLADAVRENLVRRKRPEAQEVQRLEKLIDQAAAEAHRLARGLLLADLKRGGLGAALQELAFRLQEQFGVACQYAGPARLPKLDAEAASQLYRIAQEAATNAAKHGQRTKIAIHLARIPTGLQLSVQDTGPGLPARRPRNAGVGLDIMRYRAGLIGAMFWIDSVKGKGTTVNCLLPGRARPQRRKK